VEVKINFSPPLRPATLIKRYKRFLADVRLDTGEVITVFCPNTGTMKSCSEPGRPVRLSLHPGDSRQYPYTLEMIQMDGGWVGVNTAIPNSLVALAIEYGMVPELMNYSSIHREVKYGNHSRIDILLEGPPGLCYVEVKNVSLAEGRIACFPDAVSERGTKHLNELMNMVRSGHRAVMVFLVQRSDVDLFRPADHIDPLYGNTLRKASTQGVEVLPYQALVSPEKIQWGPLLPKDLTRFTPAT
jgi:sugar fermentation stimulation protein A